MKYLFFTIALICATILISVLSVVITPFFFLYSVFTLFKKQAKETEIKKDENFSFMKMLFQHKELFKNEKL